MPKWIAVCRAAIIGCAFALLGLPALAQQPMYEIHNASNQPVSFFTMDPARGTWKTQHLQPNERKNLAWHSGAHQGKIRIGTEGRGHVQYDVQAGHRYAIVWSDHKGVWDLASRGYMAQKQGAPMNTPPMASHGGMQRASGHGAPQQLASWTLHNRSNERIEFQTLDPARGTWKNQVSYPHQSSPYTMSPGVTSGKIRIATANRGYVEYDVQAGGAYSIVWNRQSAMWDVRTRRDG